MEECKNDYEKRIQGINFDSDVNKMIFNNSKYWLFNSLTNLIKDLLKIFTDWKDNAQRNVDSEN